MAEYNSGEVMMSRWVLVVLVLAAAVVLWPGAGRACDSDHSSQVIGFSQDGATVVLRRAIEMGEGPEAKVWIELFDLSAGKSVAEHMVCESELDCDRANPRSSRRKNWRRIKRGLDKKGFTIKPEYPQATKIPALGAELVLSRGDAEMAAIKPEDLIAVKGDRQVVLIRGANPGSSTMMDTNRCEGVYLDPEQRTIFTISGGCTDGAVQVITVAAAHRKLAQAEQAEQAKQAR
jgi:hypothetical protein